jgi:hypothetical protein
MVTGTANTAVAWAVDGEATNRTITTTGLYTAPPRVPDPSTVTVRATSLADQSESGTAAVQVVPLPVAVLRAVPPTTGVQLGRKK